MKTPTRAVLSTLAVGVLMGVSGSALAADRTSVDAADRTSVETAHSALDLQWRLDASPDMGQPGFAAGQAGRAGPDMLPMTEAERQAQREPIETRHNAWDLHRDQGLYAN